MPDLAVVVLLGVAAYRIARLVAVDSLTEDLRRAVYQWAWNDRGDDDPEPRGRVRPYVYELLTCPFCVGVWAAGLVFVVWAVWIGRFPNLAVSLVDVLAVAGIAGLASAADAALTTVAD